MKPSNSGIPISLAVFCLLFQNVSSISQQERLSIRDVEEDNSLQNFTQQEWLSIRDVEEGNSLQNVMESLSKKYVLENAEPRNCSNEVEIIRMVPVLLIVVFVSSPLELVDDCEDGIYNRTCIKDNPLLEPCTFVTWPEEKDVVDNAEPWISSDVKVEITIKMVLLLIVALLHILFASFPRYTILKKHVLENEEPWNTSDVKVEIIFIMEIIASTNQGRMWMWGKFVDWITCNFNSIVFLLFVMSVTFPFLSPYTGLTGELEKLRKHFKHWHVMWAITWILLLAFLFYHVSQINNNDNSVCSKKVSGMIPALPVRTLVLLLLLIMSPGFTSASTYCEENQTAEIDAQGMINCNFPDNFYSVVWFDDVSESSSFAISCGAPCSVKKGPGFRSKYYDIFQNGSLWIPRVTVQHERPFEVFVYTSQDHFEKQTIYLKVIARPGQRLPTLDYNGITQYHYHKVNGKANVTCSFNATRPPVQLTWLQRTDEGDMQVKQQEETVFENENGTFNSYVTIDLTTTPMESRMLLFVCKANWTLQGWEKEKEILLDNRGLQSFDGEPNETLYLEQGRQANVRCKGSIGFLQLWEKTSPNNGPDMIGFTANGLTRAVATSKDPTISSEGLLIFSSPQVHNEGIYVCAYCHDLRNKVYVVAVTILIAPLPPYIHIKGCKDDNQACSLKAYDQGQISCFVMGVRPSVSLEWIASDGYKGKIAFHASNQTTKEHGATSDTELSAEYELISENINCGDNVFIKCRLSGPISHIIYRDERTVQLTRESCRPEEDKGDGFSTVPMIVIILCSILAVGLCISVVLMCKCYLKRKAANGSHSNMAAERIPMNGIENGKYYKRNVANGSHSNMAAELIPMNGIENGKLTEGKAQSCGPA